MAQNLAHVAIVVRDYDEAIAFYVGKLGFELVADSYQPEQDKRWVVVKPQGDGHFCARYFMPWATHPTLAVTGSQCLAACALAPGTVAQELTKPFAESPVTVRIEHPMGIMDVRVRYRRDDGFSFLSAGVTRTARLIAKGEVMIPTSCWSGK